MGFVEPMKSPGNSGLVSCLQDSQRLYQVGKESHFLADAEISRYLGDLKKKDINSNLWEFYKKSDGNPWLVFLAWGED